MRITPAKRRPAGLTRDYIYRELKSKIVNLELKPGTKISEKEISENLEVSRTPVREAFLQLSQEEFIKIFPQSGTVVSLIDLEQVEEARFVRESIEMGIVRLACEQISADALIQLEVNITMQEKCSQKGSQSRLLELDDNFHKLLFFGNKKMRAWKMLQQMNAHFNRLRMLRLSADLNWDIIIGQHKEIFQLIASKNSEKAQIVMRDHLRLAMIEKSVLKQQYPDFFR